MGYDMADQVDQSRTAPASGAAAPQSVAPARKTDGSWFVFVKGEKKGPFPSAMLRQLIQQGLAMPDTYVMREQDTEPRPLRQFDPVSLKLLEQFAPPPMAPEPPPPAPPEWWSWRYPEFHWRGALPPKFTALNALLPLPAVIIALYWLFRRIDLGAQGQLIAGLLLLFMLGVVGLTVWQWMGAWRCAVRVWPQWFKRWQSALKAVAGLVMALCLWWIAPPTWNWVQIAAGFDPQGRYQLKPNPVNSALQITGAPGYGLTQQVRAWLDKNPQTRLLQLELQGGRLAEAQRLRNLIGERKLVTFVEQRCSGPCTIAFVAGERRLLGPKAQLGFHRYVDPRQPHRSLASQQVAESSFFESRGVLLPVTLKMFDADPEQLWLPAQKLLVEARVVHLIAESDELQLALNAPLQFDFLNHPVMRVLKEQVPETYRKLAQQVQQNSNVPGATEAVFADAQLALETLVRERARNAADAPVQDYVRSLVALAHAAQEHNPELCYRTLFGVGNERALTPLINSFELYQHRMRAAAVVQSSYLTPMPRVEVAGRGVRVFRLALAKKVGGDALLIGTPQAEILSPEERCTAGIGYFENALRMQEEFRYDLLRGLL